MSTVTGLPPFTTEPEMWTDAAPSAAAFDAATIWAGVLEATPLPELDEELPQPARSAPPRASPSSMGAWNGGLRGMLRRL